MISIPTNCPSCSSTLIRIKDQLFCENIDCYAKNTKVVEKYANKMKIKGLGPKAVEKLGLESISDIYKLSMSYLVDILGKNGEKVYKEIQNKTEITLQAFLGAQSIPLVGTTTASKISTEIENITYESLKRDGFGDKASHNLIEWLKLNEIPTEIKFTKEIVTASSPTSFKVCISGKTPGYTKATATALLLKYGVVVVNTVNKDIKYLISETKSSAKVKKAESLNISIITIEELKRELKI